MADDKDLQFLRPLGTFERFRAVLHGLGFHYNVALGAQFTHPSEYVSVNRLHTALRDVITRLPALAITIRGAESDAPYFARLPGVDLNHVVRWIDPPVSESERDKLYDEILSKENSKGFDLKTLDPLWRIVAFKTSDTDSTSEDPSPKKTNIIFVWHHAIGDGHSGIAVLYTILNALDSAVSQENCNQMEAEVLSNERVDFVPPPNQELSPPLESLLSMQSSIRTRIRRASLTYFGDWSKKTVSKKWSGGNYQNLSPIRTLIQHIRVPSTEVDDLKQQCHRANTSITAFLQTLLTDILFQCFPDADQLMCATAISLRRFVPPTKCYIDAVTMGMWVSAFHIEYTPSENSPTSDVFDWGRARQNKERILKEIAKGDTDVETGALRGIPDFRKNLLDKIGRERQDSFAVTNLGIVKSEGDTSCDESERVVPVCKIADVVFSQSCHVNGSAVQFCIISTESADMVISLSSQESVVAQDDLNKIARLLKNKISALSKV